MMILVRDRAAPFHPVIGIAAVSSAAVAIGPRDEVLGWTLEKFADVLRSRHSTDAAAWLRRQVDERIGNIYLVDLLRDEVLRPRELEQPQPRRYCAAALTVENGPSKKATLWNASLRSASATMRA